MSIKSLFEDVADAIREKSGSSDTYTPAEMPSAIRSIPSGSSTASGVSYDNTSSGLTASNVQDAIDELAGDVSTINSDLSELQWKQVATYTASNTSTTYKTIFNSLYTQCSPIDLTKEYMIKREFSSGLILIYRMIGALPTFLAFSYATVSGTYGCNNFVFVLQDNNSTAEEGRGATVVDLTNTAVGNGEKFTLYIRE